MKNNKKNIRFNIYSENDDKSEAEMSGYVFGKWTLAWWLISGYFFKGTNKKRNKFEITIYKLKS